MALGVQGEPFGCLPWRLWRVPAGVKRAAALWAYLRFNMSRAGEPARIETGDGVRVLPDLGRVAADLGMGRRIVQQWLSALEAAGWIVRGRTGLGRGGVLRLWAVVAGRESVEGGHIVAAPRQKGAGKCALSPDARAQRGARKGAVSRAERVHGGAPPSVVGNKADGKEKKEAASGPAAVGPAAGRREGHGQDNGDGDREGDDHGNDGTRETAPLPTDPAARLVYDAVGSQAFAVWFSGCRITNGDGLRIAAPNAFTGDYIRQHFGPALKKAVSGGAVVVPVEAAAP